MLRTSLNQTTTTPSLLPLSSTSLSFLTLFSSLGSISSSAYPLIFLPLLSSALMERRSILQQGPSPIDPCFLDTPLEDVEGFSGGGGGQDEEEEAHFLMSSLGEKIPFLQMLQGHLDSDSSPFFTPNFHTLLKLQHLQNQNPWDININIDNSYVTETETQAQSQALELESCVTHDLQSPVKSETQQNPHFNSVKIQTNFSKSSPLVPRKKRKRARPVKNKEEVESQRMTHIAVERNRRRQMNDHLTALRSLMPPSYVQRGDQASIIGGAIDFVKELEQLLQSLEAERKMRKTEEEAESLMGISSNTLFPGCNIEMETSKSEDGGEKAERKSEAAEIEVAAVQNHVNLKIQCRRNQGQLLRAIMALEDLRLTVLHLNITSSDTHTAIYSFNLKIEEDCRLGSADEVAATVSQIFS
ncbi:basic helix-loop-helix (bHLH) DNA-binding superfamily protein [Euphorbia peplus]|nr:basic helix-loop-helix (bHLH) DNA-binding superfamily protein [Euphorbia peplus]